MLSSLFYLECCDIFIVVQYIRECLLMNLQEWYVLKCNSNNGLRIGISQDKEEGIEILHSKVSEKDAIRLCTEESKKLNIPEFDNNDDILW